MLAKIIIHKSQMSMPVSAITRLNVLSLFLFFAFSQTNAQTIVIDEKFDGCDQPAGWTTEIIDGEHDWQFGFIDNSKTGTTSMDGTCMVYFDDDGIGKDELPSKVALKSPVFDGSIHSRYFLELDLIYRTYTSLEDLSIFLYDGQEKHLLRIFVDDVGGPHFDVYERILLDLSDYRTNQMQVIIEYQDAGEWNWWMGVDNFLVYGEGLTQDICDRSVTLSDYQPCLEGDANYALFSGSPTSCGGADNTSLWFDYLSTFSGILKIETQSEYNDVITLFQGSCGSLTEVACYDRDEHGFQGEALYVDVNESTQYYIRVSGKESTFGKSKGTMCIKVERALSHPTTPINDQIDVYQELSLGVPCDQSMTNVDANFDTPIPSLNERTRSDIWYAFDGPSDMSIRIDAFTDFAEVISVYTKDGTNYTEIKVQDKGEPIDMKVSKDVRYYIQLAGYFATVEGNTCIEISEIQTIQVPNSSCVNAIAVPVDGTCLTSSNVGASYSGIKPSCDVYPSSDVWFTFVAPPSGKIRIKTEANFIHNLAIFEGDCTELDEFYCSNTTVACDGFVELINLEPNDEYHVQISSTSTHYDLIEGEACLTIEDATTPVTSISLALSVIQECQGDGTSKLLIEANGGSGAYTFSGNTINDILYNDEPYTVIVLDEGGCQRTIDGIINCGTDQCTLAANIETINQSCFGESDGMAMINLTSGMEPITYQWSDGSSSPELTNISPGIYAVTIVDEMKCPLFFEFEIMATSMLAMEASATAESGYNTNDGSASIITAGGQGPYTYLWSNGSVEDHIDNMPPGQYDFTITDANGCTLPASIIIPAHECSMIADYTAEAVSCNGGTDGTLSLDIALGDGPYDIIWSTGATSEIVTDLAAGNYAATITDAKDCPIIVNMMLEEADELLVEILAQNNVSCFGMNDGSIELSALGGTGIQTINWPDGSNESTRTEMAPGDYQVTTTDENNCVHFLDITITEPDLLEIAGTQIDHITCNGLTDGRAMVMVQGGTENYSYQWDDPAGQTSATAENLAAGMYTVLITDINGCTTEATIEIVDPEVVGGTIDAITPDLNFGSEGSVMITASGGKAPYTYEWILDGNIVNINEDPIDLLSGVYTLIITDSNGCILEITDIFVENVSATKDIKLAESVLIRPNPARDYCTLIFEKEMPSINNISILNAEGKRIRDVEGQRSGNEIQLQLGQLSDGLYLIEIQTNQRSIYKKLIVQ